MTELGSRLRGYGGLGDCKVYFKLGGLASNHLPPCFAESTAAWIAAMERRPSMADGY